MIVTIFVNNIPDSTGPKGLFNLFQKFGLVKDVFIPGKRRKTSRSRFGSIRNDCKVAAGITIQKANGLWCDNKELRVKRAEFEKPQRVGQSEQMGQNRGEDGRRMG
ncbi:probable splicing factor, arginine/serine-rich 4 [Camellia sinensis]|uniref:probable splicing factor, arginine/serine-rich 4 n=1 Tax=Camellia sinensis TaxID=4442 RepID=UPI00103680CB|nr:probable splicing factor, arginine/serine-rich 4 [Camellia sinensis]